jgi:predicted methyltransferase
MNRHNLPGVIAVAIVTLCAGSIAAADDAKNIYAEAVAAKTRLPGDYERDPGRKPAVVLEFFGIEAGDTVLDLFSGGGYYTELLSRVVGPDGNVLAHSNQAYLSFVGDEFAARYADDRLANVDVLMAENNELDLAPASLDAIVLVLAYHDVYFVAEGWPAIDKEKLLTELFSALKPGGVVGIVDHAALPGAPPDTGSTLHRIDPALVISDLESAGFELDGESEALSNTTDDHTTLVFDPAIRGKTDRFVLRFRKPAGTAADTANQAA